MKLFQCLGSSKMLKKAACKPQVVSESSGDEGSSTASTSSFEIVQQAQQAQQVQKLPKKGPSKKFIGRRSLESLSDAPHKHFIKPDAAATDDKLVGVVVSIFSGCSYDPMFREVEPSTVPGERISTYSIGCRQVKLLHDYLVAAMPVPDAWAGLVEDLRSVEPDSVIFNWECCDAVDKSGFPRCQDAPTDDITMRFIGLALQNGFTVMCSDFSLKALITDWSEELLGPNPFLNIGETSGQVTLKFQASDLQNDEVPQQLQVVGQLCSERGSAVVQTLGGTIVYTVNPKRAATDAYTMKVLTVVSDLSSRVPEHMQCSVGEGDSVKRGAAAHVTLTYASGGQIITSMAHWIELTKIDTSVEAVMRTAAQEFGAAEVQSFQDEMNCLATEADRYECLQKRSKQLISKSAPTRMKQRTKFSASEVLSQF